MVPGMTVAEMESAQVNPKGAVFGACAYVHDSGKWDQKLCDTHGHIGASMPVTRMSTELKSEQIIIAIMSECHMHGCIQAQPYEESHPSPAISAVACKFSHMNSRIQAQPRTWQHSDRGLLFHIM